MHFVIVFFGFILLILWMVWTVIYYSRESVEKRKMKRLPKPKPPQPKNFTNYYEYKAALIEFNERQYAEYLDKCKRGEAVYIEKEIISPKHEKRIKDYDDLISGL